MNKYIYSYILHTCTSYILRIQKHILTKIQFYAMANDLQTVYVDPAVTTIERLWEIVSEKVLLSSESAECFFIWQISKEIEILLYSEQTIQDAYPPVKRHN